MIPFFSQLKQSSLSLFVVEKHTIRDRDRVLFSYLRPFFSTTSVHQKYFQSLSLYHLLILFLSFFSVLWCSFMLASLLFFVSLSHSPRTTWFSLFIRDKKKHIELSFLFFSSFSPLHFWMCSQMRTEITRSIDDCTSHWWSPKRGYHSFFFHFHFSISHASVRKREKWKKEQMIWNRKRKKKKKKKFVEKNNRKGRVTKKNIKKILK